MEFDTYSLVILRRPPNPTEYPEEDLERIQREHLDHLDAMRARGALLAAGPLSAQPDTSLRGICIYGVGLDQARALAQDDPAVKAGRLAVDVMLWLTPKGALAFPSLGS